MFRVRIYGLPPLSELIGLSPDQKGSRGAEEIRERAFWCTSEELLSELFLTTPT